ncbi:MAG: MBOAT family O-acyltransferase [Bacteroidota bacterium]
MAFVPVYILILAFTIVIDYFAGIIIENATTKRKKKNFLILSLIANIGVLCVFKYYNFFIENIDALLQSLNITTIKIPYLSILLPIGLSFHTFQAMSYTIDVYRGQQKAERHFGIYSLYVMFFPQLVAGPIERAQALLPQFKIKHAFQWTNVLNGLHHILLGLFKKIVIADQLNVMVRNVFNDVEKAEGFSIYFASLLFIVQVYCDFSGYSNIARGSAKILGIELMENFNLPFFANSLTKLWARWHVSLMQWFRDYLYIPLGGNRVSKMRMYFNLFIMFMISGFWHGANWTYIVWGAYHGLTFIYSKATEHIRKILGDAIGLAKVPKFRHAIQIIATFHVFSFSSIFFCSKSVAEAGLFIHKLFAGFSDSVIKIISNNNFERQDLFYLGKDFISFMLVVLFLISLEVFEWRLRHKSLDLYMSELSQPKKYSLYLFVIFSVLLMSNVQETPFVYFQF